MSQRALRAFAVGKRPLIALAAVVAVACSGCATGLTGDPRSVAGTEARLFGGFVSNTGGDGGNVTYWVQWGTTTAYGSESTHRTWQFSVQPNEPQTVLINIDGLQRDTTYHYRFCAEDDQQQGGPGCGEDKTFTTPNLDCGDVITHDVVLSAPLTCDASITGLVVGADGVDIDLNGNGIQGPEGRPPKETSGVGIDNSGGFDDVTIRGGSVTRWGTAVELKDASFNTIRNVSMIQGNGSVRIDGGESNVIRGSNMTGTLFGNGLSATGTDALVVADSFGDQWVISGSDARIVRNDIGGCFTFHNSLFVSGNRNRIVDNTIGACAQGALILSSGGGNELIGNEVTNALPMQPGEGGDGIYVGAFTANTLLQDNFVHGNPDDGIDVRASSTRLQGNRADDNGDFGIDAVAGVTDGGGNTASGNGNPLQCRNVFCAASP